MRLLGVQVESAVAATLVFRGLTLWIPMIPGLLIARGGQASSRPGEGRMRA